MKNAHLSLSLCVRVCVHACACVRACVCVCVRARAYARVMTSCPGRREGGRRRSWGGGGGFNGMAQVASAGVGSSDNQTLLLFSFRSVPIGILSCVQDLCRYYFCGQQLAEHMLETL